MKLFSHSQVATIELPDQLQFVVTPENGVLDRYAPPVIAAVVLIMLCLTHHYLIALIGFICCLASLAKTLSDPTVRLFVAADQLIARGNVGRMFSDEIRADSSDLKSIGYSGGGENESSGLYAWTKTGSLCLIPNVDESQAGAIVEAIRRKFPDFEQGDTNPNSLFFGKHNEPLSLGLTDRQHSSHDTRNP